MKVHITSIPGYSKENIEQVAALLSEVKGEISYSSSDPITLEQMILIDEKFESIESIKSLSFQDFFKIANKCRVIKSIPKEDIVVVLSPVRHDLNWFSGTSGNNIFVDTRGWEYITDSDSKYGIAYQIIENIFQLLVGIEYEKAGSDPNVHHTSIGCINDMCMNKMEVISKLRSAYICVSCQKRALDKNVSKVILLQIISTIQKIRDGLMNFDLIINSFEPLPTLVAEDGEIKIGDHSIEMAALPKSLFIFFLANEEGVNVSSLVDKPNKDKLVYIYHKLRPGGKKESVDSMCLHYANPKSTFFKVKNDTNTFLIRKLAKVLSEFYVINNERDIDLGLYKIKLPSDYLTFNLHL